MKCDTIFELFAKYVCNKSVQDVEWLRKTLNTPYVRLESSKHTQFNIGDFGATEYIFNNSHAVLDNVNGGAVHMERNDFLRAFGDGTKWLAPAFNVWNAYGQSLCIDKDNNMYVQYCVHKDTRNNRGFTRDVVIAYWDAQKMAAKLAKKYDTMYIVSMDDSHSVYVSMRKGKPFTYVDFLKGIVTGHVYLDSGMVLNNPRYHSHWRCTHNPIISI